MMDNSVKIKQLEAQLKRDPQSAAFVQLAEEYRKSGHLDKAAEVCTDGLKRHPGYVSARVTLGHILFDQKKLPESRSELEAVLRQAPDNLRANKLLAEVYQNTGRLDDALDRYRIVQMLDPSDGQSLRLFHALEQEKAARAPTSPSAVRPETRKTAAELLRPSSVAPPVSEPKPALSMDQVLDLKIDESVILRADMVKEMLAAAKTDETRKEERKILEAQQLSDEGLNEIAGDDFSAPTVMLSRDELEKLADGLLDGGLSVPAPRAPAAAGTPASVSSVPAATSPFSAEASGAEFASELPLFGEPSAVMEVPWDARLQEVTDLAVDEFRDFSAPTVMMKVEDLIASGALKKEDLSSSASGRGDASPPAGATDPNHGPLPVRHGEAAAFEVPKLDEPVPLPEGSGIVELPVEPTEEPFPAQGPAAVAASVGEPFEDVLGSPDVDEFFDERGLGEGVLEELPQPVFHEEDVSLHADDPMRPEIRPAAAAVQAVAEAAGPGDDLATETLGDLYASQNDLGRALSIYETILQRDPTNEGVAMKIRSVRAGYAPDSGPPATEREGAEAAAAQGNRIVHGVKEKKIRTLTSWLASLKKN